MPRPRKVVNKTTNEQPKKPAESKMEKVENDLVSLPHFAKTGSMFIGDTVYKINNGRVAVKPEHVAIVKEHIRIGGA